LKKIYTNSYAIQGIDFQGGLHTLSHSFANHLLEQEVGLRAIQELSGKASSKTTEIYIYIAAPVVSG
jgi:site-specific recombinase XerD